MAEMTSFGRADLVKGISSAAPTSEDHNFLVQSPFCAFFDYIEFSMSLESKNLSVYGIWCPHRILKVDHCTKSTNY